MVALLTIAAWRVLHFLQVDFMFESIREKIYFVFPPPEWYTLWAEGDKWMHDDGETPRLRRNIFGREVEREFTVMRDTEDTPFLYAPTFSKLGYLLHCVWCLSIWVAGATVLTYYSFSPGTAVIDQLVHWLVIASGIVLIEKLADKL